MRESRTTTVKADLAVVWDQVAQCPGNCEVERTVPQIGFAEDTEIINLPLGLRYIVAREAVILGQEVQACERTYAEW